MIEFSNGDGREMAVAVNGQGSCVVTHFLTRGPEHTGVILNVHQGTAKAFNSAHSSYRQQVALGGKSVNIVFTEKHQLEYYIKIFETMKEDLEMLHAHENWSTLRKWSHRNGRCMKRIGSVICGRDAVNSSPDNQPTCQKHTRSLVRVDWRGKIEGA